MTRNNFAFRDYYKGAIDTNDTYLGNIIISASSGLPQVNMAVPVYSENNETLIGVWAGGLNLTAFNESPQSLNLTNNERIVYVDQYGYKVADSDKQLSNNPKNESFANLKSFEDAIDGKSGSNIEVVNGTKMIVFYEPVKFHSTTWVILWMQSWNTNTLS